MTDTPPTSPAPAAAVDPESIAPAEVAGSVVLENEPGTDLGGDADGTPEGPHVDVRGRRFALRTAIPGMLMSRISRVGADAVRLADVDPTSMTEAQQRKLTEASASTYDVFRRLVVREQVDDFIEYVEDAEPPIEFTELGEILASAMEAISGRPTQPSTASGS